MRNQVRKMVDPSYDSVTGKTTEKQIYDEALKQAKTLREKLTDSSQEKEALLKQIAMLNNELKLQENHFK